MGFWQWGQRVGINSKYHMCSWEGTAKAPEATVPGKYKEEPQAKWTSSYTGLTELLQVPVEEDQTPPETWWRRQVR